MPIQLDPTVFREERITLKAQLHRYLFDERAWGEVNRSKWFLSWYRDNQSWLATSALEKEMSSSQASEVSPLDADGKKNLARLLSNYESAPWTQQFIWWFRLPLTKLYSLNAGYDLWDRVQLDKVAATGFTSLKEAIGTHLLKIRTVSSVFAYFKQAQERIETKIKYSPSNQLKASLNESLAALTKFGRQRKGFFSWQSNAAYAQYLGFEDVHYRTVRWSELARDPIITSAQHKEREVLYYALLQERLKRCVAIISQPLPDKSAQETHWKQATEGVSRVLKMARKELLGTGGISELCARITKELRDLVRDGRPEVQLVDYQKILLSSLDADPPEPAAKIQAPEAFLTNETVLQLNRTSLALCLKLGIEGVDSESKEVSWDKVRQRYKKLCIQDHPDRCQDEAAKIEATEKFKTLQKDYQSLLKIFEGGQVEDDLGEEIREEYERADKFFNEFMKKLDEFDEKLKEFNARSERVQDKTIEVLTRYQECQDRQIEQQNKQIEQLTTISRQQGVQIELQSKHEALLREQLELQEQAKEREKILKEIKEKEVLQEREAEEVAKSLRGHTQQLEQVLLTIFNREREKTPEAKLLRLTTLREEAFLKLGIGIFNKDWDLLSWTQIRARYEEICQQFLPEHFFEQSKQVFLDRFACFQKDYIALLAALDQAAPGEDVAEIHNEVAKEREKLDKLAVQFHSDLERYGDTAVEEDQQATVSRMSP